MVSPVAESDEKVKSAQENADKLEPCGRQNYFRQEALTRSQQQARIPLSSSPNVFMHHQFVTRAMSTPTRILREDASTRGTQSWP